MAKSVADTIRQSMFNQQSASRSMLESFLGSFGMGGGGGRQPPQPPPVPGSPDDSGGQSSGNIASDMAGTAGMLFGMVSGLIKSPLQMLKPPEGSEAVIGKTNANVAHSMLDAPGDLAKGFAKDLAFTPGGPIVAGPVALGKASLKAAGSVDEWGRSLLSSVDRLRAFSPEMGAADAESRYRQFGRDMRTANVTGKSTLELSRAYQDLQDNVQPLKDDVTNALNKLTTAALQGLNTLLLVGKYAAAIVPGSAAIQELLREEQEKKQKEAQERAMTQPRQFLKEIRDGKFGENGKRVPKK